MDSTMVIKVKNGETLRRFNARINENNQLDLNMDGLRAKISSLFNFHIDANLTLTYVDEDGDVVTLVDDDDLCDVVRQNLKFLRIDIQHNKVKSGKNASVRSSGNSTPLFSSQPQDPLSNINSGVAEVLKSVPDRLRERFLKLSLDLASKASSSSASPMVTELVEYFNKLGLSFLNPNTQSAVGAELDTQNVASESNSAQVSAKDSKSSANDGVSEVSGKSQNFQTVDLNLLPTDSNSTGCPIVKENREANSNFLGAKRVNAGPKDAGDGRMGSKDTSSDFLNQIHGRGVFPFSSDEMNHVNLGSPHDNDINGNSFNECPFGGVSVASDSTLPSLAPRRTHPFKRSYNYTEAAGGMFHKGVICHGCGVHPITGPRFKSKMKEDYDLCGMCFAKMGVEADYIRLDHPVNFGNSRYCNGPHDQYQHPWMGPPSIPHVLRGCGVKPGRPKLDSRFIVDVNILDGSVIAPSTKFTKIWRMRNNGTLVWPQGTQLLWIGGDRFSEVSIEIEIPGGGVAVDKEHDIAVDFTAPQLPGRYISYWRMASPTGQKFGQRVGVLIQVDASMRNSFSESFDALNLNLPPERSGSKVYEGIDINVKPAADTDTFEPASECSKNEQELRFPLTDSFLVGQNVPVSSTPETVSYPIVDGEDILAPYAQIPSGFYPIIDFSEVGPTAPTASQVPATRFPAMPQPSLDALASSQTSPANRSVEETLLKELEEMGFKQIDLNKEILRMNEYNLERSVDDLCGVSDWDPILEELQEMGFSNKEMNKKLLVKNNGSIKRVVMDLISGEKA